ncbi:VOC family protein [Balneatrix alpica]|uniref:VOC family protein n=1 Tax=Balneatrix alpica TaxID=75684 RepID=A0ABV5Z868_9GAMM|nr:VOC family protein [Balneatrix alpica]
MPASQYLAAISLLVADYDEAIAFYCGQLGFVLLEDSPQGEGKRWVRVGPAGATTQFVLAKAQGEQQLAAVGNQGGGRVWLFLYTDDFIADYQRMQGAGVRFLEPPRHEPYGTVAVFEDLYGNKWDLLQPR